ncbi:hypothetical protein [Chitinophaga defluvii]|uniref:Uncharacterized protein n=1 Tax=Chitinophaga defluvii TaxID=3163343 RepID=A0ABV2T7U2_9BACT
MNNKTLKQLIKDQQLITSTEFNKSPYEPYGNDFHGYLKINIGRSMYYATKSFNDEICKALDFYIKSELEYSVYCYEIDLANKLSLEPAISERQLNVLYRELQYLKANVISRDGYGYSCELREFSRSTIFNFLETHFESWLCHWIEKKHINFDDLTKFDISKFHDEISNLALLERIRFVNSKIEALSNVIPDKPPLNESQPINKLTWCGTPAHLALVVDLLIEKGYLQQPTPFGERTAEQLLNMFNFTGHNPTKESLGKLLHKDRFPISDPTVIDRFQKIPHRNELKR